MNLTKVLPQNLSIMQFSQPKCLELSGKTFRLAMDNGFDTELTFTDETCARSAADGEPFEAPYVCVKGDDTTYLVSFERDITENHTYVLDMEQRLVTYVICRKGVNPKNHHQMTWDIAFGAIDLPGFRLPFKRHKFATDHMGTTVHWIWSPSLDTKHAYLEPDYYRITWDDKGSASEEFDATNEKLVSTDEAARYVRIKDDLILFVFAEEKLEFFLNDQQFFRCDNMVLMQNYDRMYQVGRCFGDCMPPEGQRHIFGTMRAYGEPVELPERFLAAENPFTV